MIDHTYETVLQGFSKKVQKQIMEEARVCGGHKNELGS